MLLLCSPFLKGVGKCRGWRLLSWAGDTQLRVLWSGMPSWFSHTHTHILSYVPALTWPAVDSRAVDAAHYLSKKPAAQSKPDMKWKSLFCQFSMYSGLSFTCDGNPHHLTVKSSPACMLWLVRSLWLCFSDKFSLGPCNKGVLLGETHVLIFKAELHKEV